MAGRAGVLGRSCWVDVDAAAVPDHRCPSEDGRSVMTTSPKGCRSAGMSARQKLLSLWVWLLLMAALFPGAHHAYGKPGGGFRGRGKGNSKKEPASQTGLSKQGLKLAGAAAAGMLGGTGTRYGLGILGRPKHGSASQHGHKTTSQDQKLHHEQQREFRNQSLWRTFVKAAAPAHSSFLTLGHVMPLLMAAWIRHI